MDFPMKNHHVWRTYKIIRVRFSKAQARPVLVVKKTSENVKIDGRIRQKKMPKRFSSSLFLFGFLLNSICFLGGTFSGKMMGK